MKLKQPSLLSLFIFLLISCEDDSSNVPQFNPFSDQQLSIHIRPIDQSQSLLPMDQFNPSTMIDQSITSPILDQSTLNPNPNPNPSQSLDQSISNPNPSQSLDQSVSNPNPSQALDQSISNPNPQPLDQSIPEIPPLADQDGDGLSDDRDLAPNDPNWPGQARPDTIYANTSTKLFALEVKTDRLIEVNTFSFEPDYRNELITDIAFDQNNVLWAISFRKLFICHAQTAFCRYQGSLPYTFNGLTWLPGDVVGQANEILVGLEREGSWYHLNLANGQNNGQVPVSLIGEYLPARLSSGDAFYIDGIGAFASIEYLLADDNQIVKISPQNPDLIDEVFVDALGYQKIYGLAGWRGFLYAFDETGTVLKINLQTRGITRLNTAPQPWWGAGVSTVLYSEDSF